MKMDTVRKHLFPVLTCLFVATLSSGWLSLAGAQPIGVPAGIDSPYGPMVPGFGQSPTPYIGAPTYNPNASSYLLYPPQSRYFQGMLMPNQPPQPSQSFYGPQQASSAPNKSCQYMTPAAPSQPGAQPPPTGIPVQGPWPGSGDLPPTLRIGQMGRGSMVPPGMAQELLGSRLNRSNEEAPSTESNSQESTEKDEEDSDKKKAPRAVLDGYSSIETGFNRPVFPGQPAWGLRQFGYALFSRPVSTFAPVEDVPVGPDYILGPGDMLRISVWGSTQQAFFQTVNRNGEINLPNAGPLRVWGLNFEDASDLIRKQLARYYRGLKSSITMGQLRIIRVYVVGEVCQPGSYSLSSLSTLTSGLAAAGGPVKLGSLRNIELKRNNLTVGTIDLYDFLLSGDKTKDFRLQSGDTIFVPPLGPVAAIMGEVKRPAIYELKDTTHVRDLIRMAGGGTPRSYFSRVQVVRTKPNAEREVIDLDLSHPDNNGGPHVDIALRDGDQVRVYEIDPRIYNTVRLAGAVKYPGEYQFKKGMRLSHLVREKTVLPEAYVQQVEIARLKNDLTTDIIEVNLRDAWAGDENQDVKLKPLDQITLRSEFKMPWRVMLSGEIKRPGTFTIKRGEHLSSVLKRAGGFTEKAYLKGAILTRESVRVLERKKLNDFVQLHRQNLLAKAGTIGSGIGTISKEETDAQQTVLKQRMDLLDVLTSKVELGRVVIQLDQPEKLEGSPYDLALQDGDTLHIPIEPSSVMVVGSVRSPTAVLYKDGEDVQYYVNRAGGFSRDAAQKETYIAKADGSAITGFVKLREIDPGDAIVVPPSTDTKIRWIDAWKDVVTIVGQGALGVAAVAGIVALQ